MIIALMGNKTAGKDTAAQALVQKNGFTRIAFADPIKKMIAAYLQEWGLNPEEIQRHIDGDLKEVPSPYLGNKSPRYAMQTLRTEWGRHLISDSLWIDLGMHKATRCPDSVITDCRFINEATRVVQSGGHLIRIIRPDLSLSDTHVSETELNFIPYPCHRIINDSTIDALQQQLINAVVVLKEEEEHEAQRANDVGPQELCGHQSASGY